VDHLVVDDELATAVVDDESTHAAATLLKGLTDATEEVALRDDGETLLDVAGLGHGDDLTVIAEVEDAVGLVDRAQHGLDDDGGRGVRDKAGLLLQLAGEEVDTQVAVLAGLGRHGDPDDLAGAALEDQDVADANKVAGDGDRLGGGATTGLNDADILADTVPVTNWTAFVSDDNFFTVRVVVMMVLVIEGVKDAVGSAFHATTEGVVVTVVVVVTHLASGGLINYSRSLKDLDVGGGRAHWLDVEGTGGGSAVSFDGLGLVGAVVGDVEIGLGGTVDVGGVLTSAGVLYRSLVGAVVGVDVVGRLVDTTTIFTLSDVKLGLKSLVVDLLTVVDTDRRLAVTLTSKVYFGVTGRLHTLLGVGKLLVVLGKGTARIALNVDIDFFLAVDTGIRKPSRGSSIFPFDVRSAIEIDFSLYSFSGSKSSLRNSVTPVRRREDTEGDGDAGVKVQIGCPLGVSSRMPFELLETTRKARQEKTLFTGKSFSWKREGERS
jgi:hypothetical protein